MARHELTTEEKRRGGQTTAKLPAPGPCPQCGREYETHMQYAGHLGLHAFADKYTGGDLRAAGIKLGIIGAASTDPFPGNSAYAEGHRYLADIKAEKLADVDEYWKGFLP